MICFWSATRAEAQRPGELQELSAQVEHATINLTHCVGVRRENQSSDNKFVERHGK